MFAVEVLCICDSNFTQIRSMIRIKYAIHCLVSCAITLKKINAHFVDTEFLMEIYCNCKKLPILRWCSFTETMTCFKKFISDNSEESNDWYVEKWALMLTI